MIKMKKLSLIIVLAVATAVSAATFAQDATKKAGNNKTDSCCQMPCCKTGSCCKGDSCEMKNEQNHSSKHEGCCCCSGDSCEMGEMKNKQKQG